MGRLNQAQDFFAESLAAFWIRLGCNQFLTTQALHAVENVLDRASSVSPSTLMMLILIMLIMLLLLL